MYRHILLRFQQNLDALQTPKKFSLNAGREDMPLLFERRNATTFCHSQHAKALFSTEVGYINQF